MANYALLDDNNIVINVINGPDEDGEVNWEQYYSEVTQLRCKRTSYNTCGGVHSEGKDQFRMNYASVGYTYDEKRDAFIPAKEFSSWILDDSTCRWKPPIPYPDDGYYVWNEKDVAWQGPIQTEAPLDIPLDVPYNMGVINGTPNE